MFSILGKVKGSSVLGVISLLRKLEKVDINYTFL